MAATSPQVAQNPTCNRKVCSNQAFWWNTSTLAYYCTSCALKINQAAKHFDGVEQLCIRHSTCDSCQGLFPKGASEAEAIYLCPACGPQDIA